jgi:hypothetical protein
MSSSVRLTVEIESENDNGDAPLCSLHRGEQRRDALIGLRNQFHS